MIFFLDTSVLVAALTHEAETEHRLRWLGEQGPQHLAISDWAPAEFSSVLAIRPRSGHIETGHQAA